MLVSPRPIDKYISLCYTGVIKMFIVNWRSSLKPAASGGQNKEVRDAYL